MKILRKIIIMLIKGYQKCLSPVFPPMCRYEPTCSNYMIQAIERKGIIKGTLKGLWRIARCHPFAKGGWDPVDSTDKPKYL